MIGDTYSSDGQKVAYFHGALIANAYVDVEDFDCNGHLYMYSRTNLVYESWQPSLIYSKMLARLADFWPSILSLDKCKLDLIKLDNLDF